MTSETGWIVAVGLGALPALALRALERRRVRAGLLDAAHELARPLTLLRLALESESRAVPDGVLASEVLRAATVLDDLRGLAGVPRTGQAEVLDLAAVVEEVVSSWVPAADAVGRALAADCAEGAIVLAERARIARAIDGLVANAIEHGSGPVAVRVLPNDGVWRIAVVDRGGGTDKSSPTRPRPGIRRFRTRGRGLGIVASAVAEAGGRFERSRIADGVAAFDLPALGGVG